MCASYFSSVCCLFSSMSCTTLIIHILLRETILMTFSCLVLAIPMYQSFSQVFPGSKPLLTYVMRNYQFWKQEQRVDAKWSTGIRVDWEPLGDEAPSVPLSALHELFLRGALDFVLILLLLGIWSPRPLWCFLNAIAIVCNVSSKFRWNN